MQFLAAWARGQG